MVKKVWNIIKETFKNFGKKKVFKLSAALAYYTVFSLPALLIIIIWIAEGFLGTKAVEGSVYLQIQDFVGTDAAIQIQNTIKNAAISSESSAATFIGILTMILGSTGAFIEMQGSLNYIWDLKAKHPEGKGWIQLIFTRLISFSMVVSMGFLLLVSLLVNSAIEFFMNSLREQFPAITVVLAYIINLALTIGIATVLFGMILKVLPDAHIKWKDVRMGAFVTACLFVFGKFLIAFYLGSNKMSSAYGAAGSVVMILLWVFYSSAILYLGAVFTRVYARARGSMITPSKYAVVIEEVERESRRPAISPTTKRTVKSPEEKR